MSVWVPQSSGLGTAVEASAFLGMGLVEARRHRAWMAPERPGSLERAMRHGGASPGGSRRGERAFECASSESVRGTGRVTVRTSCFPRFDKPGSARRQQTARGDLAVLFMGAGSDAG